MSYDPAMLVADLQPRDIIQLAGYRHRVTRILGVDDGMLHFKTKNLEDGRREEWWVRTEQEVETLVNAPG